MRTTYYTCIRIVNVLRDRTKLGRRRQPALGFDLRCGEKKGKVGGGGG